MILKISHIIKVQKVARSAIKHRLCRTVGPMGVGAKGSVGSE